MRLCYLTTKKVYFVIVTFFLQYVVDYLEEVVQQDKARNSSQVSLKNAEHTWASSTCLWKARFKFFVLGSTSIVDCFLAFWRRSLLRHFYAFRI